jgi:DNA-binding response OmpR family regulator
MHVVVLTVDEERGAVVHRAFEREGHSVVVTANTAQLPPAAALDLVVLDVAAFGARGLDICRQLDQRGIPVLALVGGPSGRIAQALDAGASDGLPRCSGAAELLARARAVARRTSRQGATVNVRVGDLELSPARYEARYSGRPVHLSPTEFRILHYLAVRAGRVVPTAELVRAIWGDGEANPELVRVNVYRLRQKLETDPRQPRLLRSVPGPGLILDVPRAAS